MASGKVVRYFLETTNTGDPRSGNRVVTEKKGDNMATPTKEKRDAIARLTKAWNLAEQCGKELQEGIKLADKAGLRNQSYIMEAQSACSKVKSYTQQGIRQV